MNVLHITMKAKGGAANGAVRTHLAMLEEGIDSEIMFMFEEDVPSSRSFCAWAEKHQRIRLFMWKLQGRLLGHQIGGKRYKNVMRLHRHPAVRAADVILLHQVDGFIDLKSFLIRATQRVLWLCPDFAPITRGHHYPTPLEPGWNDRVYERVEWVFTTEGARRRVQQEVWKEKSFPSIVMNYPLLKKWEYSHVEGSEPRNRFMFIAADVSNRRKGFRLVHELWQKHPEWPMLTVVGKGWQGFKQASNIEFLGFQSNSEIAKLLASSLGLITPATQEMFGQTTSEALALGTPVISAETIGGLELIEDGRTGYILPLWKGEDDQALLEKAVEAIIAGQIDFDEVLRLNADRFSTKVVQKLLT